MAYAMALTLIMPKELPMAKPNYSFEKRQRELAKKKKKEEKRLKKESGKDLAADAPAESEESPSDESAPSE